MCALDCQVKCGEVVLRTAAKSQTTTPEWNQELRFGVKKPLGDAVVFKVFAFSNEDKDELLGEVALTIADLPADETVRLAVISMETTPTWVTTLLLYFLVPSSHPFCALVFRCTNRSRTRCTFCAAKALKRFVHLLLHLFCFLKWSPLTVCFVAMLLVVYRNLALSRWKRATNQSSWPNHVQTPKVQPQLLQLPCQL